MSSVVAEDLLALHLVGGRADRVPQDAVLLLESIDLGFQLLPHLLKLHNNNRIESPCRVLRSIRRRFLHIFQIPDLPPTHTQYSEVAMTQKNKQEIKTSIPLPRPQSPHLYLHGLQLLVAALCFGLHAPKLFLHGCTLVSHHSLHPARLLLLNMKLLKHRSKRA